MRDSNPHNLRRQDLNLVRLPIPPIGHLYFGAPTRTRTADPLITNQMLPQNKRYLLVG